MFVIKEDAEYEGVRVNVTARIGTARLELQVDVGFGDAVTPAASIVELPDAPRDATGADACARTHASPSSPRSSRRWCTWASPTAG